MLNEDMNQGEASEPQDGDDLKVSLNFSISPENKVENGNHALRAVRGLFSDSQKYSDAEFQALTEAFDVMYREVCQTRQRRAINTRFKIDLSQYGAEERNKVHPSGDQLKNGKRDQNTAAKKGAEEKKTQKKKAAFDVLGSLGFKPEDLLKTYCMTHGKPKSSCGCV